MAGAVAVTTWVMHDGYEISRISPDNGQILVEHILDLETNLSCVPALPVRRGFDPRPAQCRL